MSRMPTLIRAVPLLAMLVAFASVILLRPSLPPAYAAAADRDVRVINSATEPVPTLVQGTPSVRLVHDAANPVLMRSVDEPARHPFQTTVAISIPTSDGAASGFVTIPAGKRLVVEFVSVHGNVAAGRTLLVQLSTFGAVGEVHHEVALTGPRPLGNDIYVASQPVRIYADESLSVRAVHSASAVSLASNVQVGISGYLVDIL